MADERKHLIRLALLARKSTTARFAAVAVPGLLITLLFLGLSFARPGIVTQVANLVFDAYQRAYPRPYEEAPVRVVDIDDETIARLGQWPWPRIDVANLAQRISDAGAAAVCFDIVFSEPDRTSPARAAEILRRNPLAKGSYADVAALADHDALLGQTMARTPSVVGYFLTREANPVRPIQKAGFAMSGSSGLSTVSQFRGAIAPLPQIADGAAGGGFVSVVGDRDGVVRSATLIARVGDQLYPSLALECLRVAQGAGAFIVKSTDGSGQVSGGKPGVVSVKVGQFELPTTRSGQLWIYYTTPHPERVEPAWKIMTGQLTQAQMTKAFQGRIVFIGTGASGLRDLVATPVRDRELGVMVHAEAVEQAILGRFLNRPDWSAGVESAAVLFLGLIISLSLPALGALRGGLLATLAFIAVVGGSWAAFRYGRMLLDPTMPAMAVVGVYVAGTVVSFYREERARAYIRNAFDRYLSPELVRRIARDPSRLNLGGEERDMTVMFCDIRSFSRISESLAPQQIIGFLIDFLTPMTDILLARKATIDKYIGDAILAFWNAPLEDPAHERNAAYAALEMIERLDQLNAAAPDRWPGEVKIGIGMNAGPCCVGNMGSKQRLSYSLIGDTVNLASRIEGLTKVYGVPIALGEQLAARLEDFAVIELDRVRVVGRDHPERIFGLFGPPEMAATREFQDLKSSVRSVLEAYRSRKWSEAQAGIDSLADPGRGLGLDKLLALYRGRLETYRDSPPPPEWDYVFEATEK